MAFALKSKFILLDEPTSGVATGDKFKVMDTIVSAIRREKMACMIIEHDMDIVSDYSDRVLVLSEGEIIADGKPEQVMEQDNVKEILFGIRA
jgi:branched-chain amino acid transport system ATP-binding protein